MAKSNKLSKKTKKAIKENTLVSIVIASFLINLFFFTGLIIYNSTTEIDHGVYVTTKDKFCNDSYAEYLGKLQDTSSDYASDRAALNIECVKSDFVPYYEQAVNEYMSDLGL